MPAYSFFVVSYDKEGAPFVDAVCEQLEQACRGERLIVTAPDGILVEQFDVSVGESWEGDD